LKELVDDVGLRLRASGRYARTARLKIRWDDFTSISRQSPFPDPICDDRSLMDAAFALFRKERLIGPVRLIGFGVSDFTNETAPEQQMLFGSSRKPARAKSEKFAKVSDNLRKQFGDKIKYPGRSRPKRP